MIKINDFNKPPYALPLSRLGKLFPSYRGKPPRTSNQKLTQWKMEDNDAPIIRYIYRAVKPRRHLEFGTWQGMGTVLCLKSSKATVWTINLPQGEDRPDGSWAYGERVLKTVKAPPEIITTNFGEDELGPVIYHRTDAGGYIGRFYREKGLGNRVCQIYCDSSDWDISNYPEGFFDSVLVDGSHHHDVVISDTRKALHLLRPGGVMLWHDFCPQPYVRKKFQSVNGVTKGIRLLLPKLIQQMEKIHWIDPSWILIGIKK